MSRDNVDLTRLEAFSSVAVVAVAEAAGLPLAVAAVERTVAEFDQACSRFRDDSELTALNQSSGQPVRVGPVLLEAVDAALRAARLTGGAVDPTVGRAMIAIGYDRDFAELERADGLERAEGLERADGLEHSTNFERAGAPDAMRRIAAIPGWQTVVVDLDAGTIRTPPGVMIDLGATAKALAADRAAARACEAAGCGVLVSFGGDLAMVGAAPAEGWRVRVTDDHRAGVEAPGQWISLRSGGLATSSTFVRRWRTGAGVAHHLVDPATGRSADSVWRTASVAAASCLDANIASTAAIIRGAPAQAWLESHGLPARLVHVDGTVRHVAGWPAEDDDLPTGEALSALSGAAEGSDT